MKHQGSFKLSTISAICSSFPIFPQTRNLQKENNHSGPCITFKPLCFWGTRAEDPKVSVDLGEKMTHVLSACMGMDVTWKAYERLEHGYRVGDEIQDILNFLRSRVQLPVEPESSPNQGRDENS